MGASLSSSPSIHTSLDAVMTVAVFLSDSRWLVLVAGCRYQRSAHCDATSAVTAALVLGGAYGLAFGLQEIFLKFSPYAAVRDGAWLSGAFRLSA
jgi:hypothetical protein